MATTIQIQNTVNWVNAFIVQRPQTGVGGIANEPALTAANKIMATILAPPFRWSWNRVESSALVTSQGVTDYQIQLSNFGWLEKAVYTNADLYIPTREISIVEVVGAESQEAQPAQIAPFLDDNNGNITFRILPAPDGVYTIRLTYQQSPNFASNLNGLWAPIPDKFCFLYETALLAHMQGMYSPQLYAFNMEMFFKQLIGASEGLKETEKAIFLEDRLREVRATMNAQIGTQQGRQARL